MARDLAFQITDGTNTYQFAIDGEFNPDPDRHEYRSAPDVNGRPVLIRTVKRWRIERARIVGSSTANAWSLLSTFLGHLEDRGTTPLTAASIIADPDGTPSTLYTLGPSTFQRFQIVDVGYPPEVRELAPARWRTVIPISLTVEAERVYTDSTTGIVDWSQIERHSYENGLHRLEWETIIETPEGTDAVAKAQTYCKIPIDDYGSSYTWDTNGDDGVDIEILDADHWDDGNGTTRSRTPTRVRAVSRIRQHGAAVGSPTAGNSVNAPLDKTTETVLEGRQTRVITRAEANGPGALAWVQTARPTGGVAYSREKEWVYSRRAEGEWHTVTTEGLTIIGLRLSGGGQDAEYVKLPGRRAPVLALGGLAPYRLTVEIRVEMTGTDLRAADMRFPPRLAAPWRLLDNLTEEDAEPVLLPPPGLDVSTYARTALLVYESPTLPTRESLTPLLSFTLPDVTTYKIAPAA